MARPPSAKEFSELSALLGSTTGVSSRAVGRADILFFEGTTLISAPKYKGMRSFNKGQLPEQQQFPERVANTGAGQQSRGCGLGRELEWSSAGLGAQRKEMSTGKRASKATATFKTLPASATSAVLLSHQVSSGSQYPGILHW